MINKIIVRLLLPYAVLSGILLKATPAFAQQFFVTQGLSHNDYLQKHPLFDAVHEGFINIEADIFLHRGKLIVAHWFPYGKQKTLEQLYLSPLSEMMRNRNFLSGERPAFTLLIDIKSSPEPTYRALKPVLEKYGWMLSAYEKGAATQGRVNVVLTGRRPVSMIQGEKQRLVTLDDALNKPSFGITPCLYAMASCKYSSLIKSNNTLTAAEKSRLKELVAQAHFFGKKTRLWASPEKDTIRRQLLDCGIDLINTDRLADLKDYFINRSPKDSGWVAIVVKHPQSFE